jgi:hypothetical protein
LDNKTLEILEFRTIVNPEKSGQRIDYNTPLFFIGSCFSDEIGSQLKRGKFDTTINPFGIQYNPTSVANTLNKLIDGISYEEDDLYKFNDSYLSFDHDTSFTASTLTKSLDGINSNLDLAHKKLKDARFLFITFGTARVFRQISSGRIVSNCHKIPAKEFSRELLDVDTIVSLWRETINKLRKFNNNIELVFTVSPVRHWKDGAHGNQISKSILFIAIERMLEEGLKGMSYFPSYELMIDDLRDYRYYNDDMLHPSATAVKYIWDFFSETYIDKPTLKIYREISRLVKSTEHRLSGTNGEQTRLFREKILAKINAITSKYPFIDMSDEVNYFQ